MLADAPDREPKAPSTRLLWALSRSPGGEYQSSRPAFVSDTIAYVRVRFTQAARRHKIGQASVLFVMEENEPVVTTTKRGQPAMEWTAADERGRELHIIAVPLAEYLLVTHVFPTALMRRKDPE